MSTTPERRRKPTLALKARQKRYKQTAAFKARRRELDARPEAAAKIKASHDRWRSTPLGKLRRAKSAALYRLKRATSEASKARTRKTLALLEAEIARLTAQPQE